MSFDNFARGFNAIHARHLQVHQNNVWIQFCSFGNDFISITGFTHDCNVRRIPQQGAYPLSIEDVIICNQHFDGHLSILCNRQLRFDTCSACRNIFNGTFTTELSSPLAHGGQANACTMIGR